MTHSEDENAFALALKRIDVTSNAAEHAASKAALTTQCMAAWASQPPVCAFPLCVILPGLRIPPLCDPFGFAHSPFV